MYLFVLLLGYCILEMFIHSYSNTAFNSLIVSHASFFYADLANESLY
jgi:hypothetical protein